MTAGLPSLNVSALAIGKGYLYVRDGQRSCAAFLNKG